MKELFYFSKSDLMIQVHYSQNNNSLCYASHRRINDGEKQVVERYINENVVNEDKNPQYSNASLDYNGVDFKLINHLNQFHAVKSLKNSDNAQSSGDINPFNKLNRKDIDRSVKNLIKTSMENYYFEKIGTTIIEARQKKENGARNEEMEQYKSMLEELVIAYNSYSRQKVNIADVISDELCV